jgi:hypothetical protein
VVNAVAGNLSIYRTWNAPVKVDPGGGINVPAGGSGGQIAPVAQNPISTAQSGQIAYSGNEANSKKTDSPAREKQTISPAVDEKGKTNPSESAKKMMGFKECQTCKRRRYVDGSSDSGVSFKSPTHVSPESAPMAVSGHEAEHVHREQDKAKQQGREVVYQNVQIFTGVCPECGRIYVSGGKTTTVTQVKPDSKIANTQKVDLYV